MSIQSELIENNNIQNRIAILLNEYISNKIKEQAKKEGIDPEQLIEIILHGYFEELEND